MLNDVLSNVKRVYKRVRPLVLTVLGLGFVLLSLSKADSTTTFLQFTMIGIAIGAVYALAATGVVLTYTTTGIFNFAHGAVGMIATMTFWKLSVSLGWPTPLAALVVLGVMAPAMALLLEVLFRRFRDADVSTTIVLTIAVTVLCIGLAQKLFGADVKNLPFLFGDRYVEIFDARISYDNVFQVLLAVVVAIGLRVLLFRSRAGTAMRAVVDNPNLAALNGASPVATARLSWLLGTELAVVAGILFGAGKPLEAVTLTFFVVNAYGAAVFGKLKSLPLTFAGGIVLSLVEQWGKTFTFPKTAWPIEFLSANRWIHIGNALPGLFLFFALLALPQARLTVGRVVGRRSPRAPSLIPSLVGAGAFLAAMALVIEVLPTQYSVDAIRAMVIATLMLSLVVLTGFSGQVSLAQYVFFAIGAWMMGRTFNGDSVVGMVLAGVVAVPVGAIVALPALRLQGLYLALVTFGFAALAQDLIIGDESLFGATAAEVGRLQVAGFSFESDQRFFLLCSVVFALFAVLVVAVKRGSLGRRLGALRDSPAACATLGLDIRRLKLLVFCMSAFIAGVAGSLFGGLQSVVSAESVTKEQNIILFLFAVVGGVTTATGALLGGILFSLFPLIESKWPEYAGVPFVVVAVVAVGLGRQPNGLAGILFDRFERVRRPRRADAGAAAAPSGDGVVREPGPGPATITKEAASAVPA
ncbi:MAG: ABC transporter permease [Acidimicrobiia bacterium]|nr:ABC transporter permease [Acidimicrobiia bacterium]